MRFMRVVLVLVSGMLIMGHLKMWAQATSSLSGHVTDTQGALIPGARVTLTLTGTGAVREDTTNKNGEYHFPQILPGRYELDVSSKGFALSKNTGLDVMVDQPATYNVSLPIATANADVSVNANIQPLLNTTDATLGNTLDAEQVEDLPTAARNTNILLTLQPGVVYLGPSKVNATGNDTRSGAVNGGRSDQGNLTLDGVGVNDINNGGDFSPILRITQDTVAEFRVTTSDPTAEQGRSSGAQTAMVTKSGGNAFHGSAYEYNKSNLWQANDFFVKQTEANSGKANIPGKLIYNVFGATAAGPIVKNKAFYFGNYEGLRQIIGGNASTIVPTASFRAGNVIYVCAKATQCTGTSSSPALAGDTLYTLTPTQVASMDPKGVGADPVIIPLLQSLPLPNNFTEGDLLNFAGYDFIYSTQTSNNDFTARFDWNITSNGKHTAFWRGTQQADTSNGAPSFPGQPPSQRLRSHNKGFAAGYTYVHSSDLVNNMTFGLTRQGTSTSGQLSSPYVTFYFTTPYATTATTSSVVPVYNLVDNLSWTFHNHNFAFGTNMRFIEDIESSNQTAYAFASGVQQYFNGGIAGSGNAFDPGGYGYPAVAAKNYNGRVPYNNAITALAGLLSIGTVSYNTTKTGAPLAQGSPLVYDYRWNEYEFYAQDTWKATKDLTLTYGLRYSYQQVPAETGGAQVGVCQIVNGACAPGAFSLAKFLNTSSTLGSSGQPANNAGELGFPLNGRYNGKPDYWTPDKLDFAPRVSIAYSPTGGRGLMGKLFGNGKSSIRAGFSLAYDHFGAGIVNTFASTGSYGLATTLSTNAGTFTSNTAPRITSLTSVPSALLPPAPVVGFPGIPPNSGPSSAQIYWSEDSAIKTPYSEMVDFSIARQIHDGSSIEISYVGRFAHRLPEQEDVAMPTNLAAAGTTYFAAARQLSQLANANTPITSVPTNPYWETLFAPLAGKNLGYGCGNGCTATQNVYGQILANLGNESQALYNLDLPNSITGAGINANQAYPSYRFYHDQFSALFAWRSVGNSNYNALQAVYRQRFNYGLHADFNYSFSKSLDITSQAERETDSGLNNGSQIINTWSPNQLYGPSDFDIRHQITSDLIWSLPVGRGQQFLASAGRLADEVVGGWQLTGIVRWTSGMSFEIVNGNSFYPTNWDIEGYETLTGPLPKAKAGSDHAPGISMQQVFANPTAAEAAFSHALPGDSGTRNPLRGDGYFEIDTGLGKTLPITERVKLKLGVEIFNVSNSVRFDPRTIGNDPSDNPAAFGYATQALTSPREAQFYGRFQF